jgi:hypothetical protein
MVGEEATESSRYTDFLHDIGVPKKVSRPQPKSIDPGLESAAQRELYAEDFVLSENEEKYQLSLRLEQRRKITHPCA